MDKPADDPQGPEIQTQADPDPDPDRGALGREPRRRSSCYPISTGAARAFDVAIVKGRVGIQRILEASNAEIGSRSFLLDCIRQVGIRYQDWRGLAPFSDYMNSVDYGIIQIPTEFADYLMMAGASRPSTAIEIGVFRGATAYIAAAYFYRLNKNHQYVAVDVIDDYTDFDYFKDLLPITKAAPCTSGEFAGERFDVAFIDGDHSYDGSRTDWLNVGRSSGFVAFHDINGAEYDSQNGGIRRTWSELKLEYRATRSIMEISHCSNWMGIGLILNRSPIDSVQALMSSP